MKNGFLAYLTCFILAVFTINAVVTLIQKVADAKVVAVEAEDDASAGEKDDSQPSGKKFQYNPNTMPFDDDICHDFHFSNYFVGIKQVKYTSAVPPLREAVSRAVDSPPKI